MSREISRSRRSVRMAVLLTLTAAAFLATAWPVVGGLTSTGALSRPSDASRYGAAVAVDETGDTVVVGAPGIGNGLAPGRAFVYGRTADRFTLLATLRSADDVEQNGFGSAVAIQGDKIVVGAGNPFSVPGRAYVFVRPAGGWSGTLTETATLAPSTTARNGFGRAVAIDGSVIAVGDGQRGFVFSEPSGGWSGGLTEVATLPSPTVVGTGFTIAIDGNVIVAGNPDTTAHRDAYVYLRPAGGWAGSVAASATLTVSIVRGFGAVAIDDATIVVGASQAVNGTVLAQGAAYVFVRPAAGWAGTLAPSATLMASDGGSFDELGASVAVDGSTIAVGNRSGVTDGTQNDGAYIFEAPSGGWAGTLTESAAIHSGSAGEFGRAVAFRNGTLVVGDPLSGTTFNFQGAAYVYLPDGDADRVPDVVDNCPSHANRDQADVDLDGAGDACDLDDDADGLLDTADNCPLVANTDQVDNDGDGLGDACDPDSDGDGVANGSDNCVLLSNSDQANLDGDASGDACDPDDDGDGVLDALDSCPVSRNAEQRDLDADGVGDACDIANEVLIDVLPGVSPNALRKAGRLVPVTILSSATFDATARVDRSSLRFGRAGTEAPVFGTCRAADVNGDGRPDLTCDFESRLLQLGTKDVVATLRGATLGDEATTFAGTDSVTMTRPR